MLLEELAKHQDWIEFRPLSENLNLSAEELQEHPLNLSNYFQTSLFDQEKRHPITV